MTKWKKLFHLWKRAKEVLFNVTACLLILFCSSRFSSIYAQVPDYSLDHWMESEFNQKSTQFFKLLTLQLNHSQIAYSPSDHRVGIGFSTRTGHGIENSELIFFSGKQGIFPVFDGSVWISPNLRIKGSYAGFPANKDVVMFTGFGLDIFLNGSKLENQYWLVNIQRGCLEGMDDFFLKTIGVGIYRGVNYPDGSGWWLGLQSNSYSAGVHVHYEDNEVYRKRLKGDISSLKWGGSRNIGFGTSIYGEIGVHLEFISVMFGIYKII